MCPFAFIQSLVHISLPVSKAGTATNMQGKQSSGEVQMAPLHITVVLIIWWLELRGKDKKDAPIFMYFWTRSCENVRTMIVTLQMETGRTPGSFFFPFFICDYRKCFKLTLCSQYGKKNLRKHKVWLHKIWPARLTVDMNSNIQMFKWKTDKEFYTVTICGVDLTPQGTRRKKKRKKAAGFERVWICISSN